MLFSNIPFLIQTSRTPGLTRKAFVGNNGKGQSTAAAQFSEMSSKANEPKLGCDEEAPNKEDHKKKKAGFKRFFTK